MRSTAYPQGVFLPAVVGPQARGRRRVAPVAVAIMLVVLVVGVAPMGTDIPPVLADMSGSAVVRRLAGPERATTAAAVAADGWITSTDVVVVDGWDYPAALAGAHLAARLDAPVLTSGPRLPEVTRAAITRLAPRRLIVVGDAAVGGGTGDDPSPGGEDVEEVVRIDAPTTAGLAATALELDAGTAAMPVVLVSQATFADALAAANLAPARILFTDPGTLSPESTAAIGWLDPAEVVVLGGSAAIDEAVVRQVRALGPVVRRVAGPSRYDTALAAQRPGASRLVVASGQDFADAVAFVPWAARHQAALLVTTHDEIPSTILTAIGQRQPVEMIVAGGTAAVGNHVDRQLRAVTGIAPLPPVVHGIRSLTQAERRQMTGTSWRPGCPVGLDRLAVLAFAHWDFNGNVVDDARLVVHQDWAASLAQVVRTLFDARFPLEQARPVAAYGGDDQASMAANNSSAFNCRTVAGTTSWSQHAYGTAVDLNPVQNPHVDAGGVTPKAGSAYVDRGDVRPGMIVRPGPVVEAFADIGWGWGGDFINSRDYQHFSASGG